MTIEPTIPKRPISPTPTTPPSPPFEGGATGGLEAGGDSGAVAKAEGPLPTSDEVMTALRAVVDPEINMNIVDLGLVYEVEVTPEGDVEVRMALTSPGCPFGPQIVQNVTDVSKALPGVRDAFVEIVWEPPWGPHKMSEEARMIFGF